MRYCYKPTEVDVVIDGVPHVYELHVDGKVYERIDGSLRRRKEAKIKKAVYEEYQRSAHEKAAEKEKQQNNAKLIAENSKVTSTPEETTQENIPT